jgi:hypothetical protein
VPSFLGLQKFFGRTVSEAAAFAAGGAVAESLRPVLQDVENEAWQEHPARPLEAEAAAAIVAEDVELAAWGTTEASQTGIDASRFQALLNETLNAPGLGELYTLWRRGAINDALFIHGLRKAKLELTWDQGLEKLKTGPADPATLAAGVVRGLVPDPGILPVGPPTEAGTVKAFPVFDVNVTAAVLAAGLDFESFKVMVGNYGRPMSLHEAASAYFRGIIELADYQRAVSEGDTRNEWRDAVLEQAREITTAHDAVENTLRGYSDQTTMYARTARHGMSKDDTDIMFQNAGRPLPVHQITTGLARGGTFQPIPGELTDPYEASVHEANLKPSYYDLAIANKYTLPGYFVVKAMLTASAITQDEAATIFKQEGWPPDLADKAAAALAHAPTTSTNSLVKSHSTTATRKVAAAYIGGAITQAEATTHLTTLGVSPADQTALFKVWDVERAVKTEAPPAGG